MATFVGDALTVTIHTGTDVSTFTSKYLKYTKPNGDTGKLTIIIDPSDSTSFICTIVAGVLDQAGIWAFQVYVSVGSSTYHGELVQLKVLEKIPLTTTPPTTLAPTTLP